MQLKKLIVYEVESRLFDLVRREHMRKWVATDIRIDNDAALGDKFLYYQACLRKTHADDVDRLAGTSPYIDREISFGRSLRLTGLRGGVR